MADNLPERVLAAPVALFRDSPPDMGTSILADRMAGRHMEWDVRNGIIRRKAARHGIAMPISDVLLAAAGRGQRRSGWLPAPFGCGAAAAGRRKTADAVAARMPPGPSRRHSPATKLLRRSTPTDHARNSSVRPTGTGAGQTDIEPPGQRHQPRDRVQQQLVPGGAEEILGQLDRAP